MPSSWRATLFSESDSPEFATISDYLSWQARVAPDRLAVVSPEAEIPYRDLESQTNRCVRGLQSLGLRRGMRCALLVTPGIEFVVLVLSLIRMGAVVVAVDPGIGRRHLADCLQEAAPEAFIGVPRAHLARILLGWARKSLRIFVTVGRTWIWGGKTFRQVLDSGDDGGLAEDALPSVVGPEETAAIVFTSGSTGVPKGVVYTHRMMIAQARMLRERFGIEPGEVDLATFPLFALFDVVWGATAVFPRMDFTRPARVDPREIIARIEKNRVTHMFGSPALLNRVGRYGREAGIRLPGLRRAFSAGAPVPADILRRFAGLLDEEVEVFTPYGATEALPVCSIGHRERLAADEDPSGFGVCIGFPLEGVGLRVIPISEEPVERWDEELCLPAGKIGELVVWGPNVSLRYFGRPDADRLAKIISDDGIIRHRMGDCGYLDREGRVWFCGRKSHRVVTRSGTLFTVPCESVFNRHPGVFRSALVGVGARPNQVPVLCVELEDRKNWRGSGKLREELLRLGERSDHTRTIRTILFSREFPVDIRHNSKIFREKLALWAARCIREARA